jgi:methanogenic corrinoid protein MtbC1
MPGDTPVLRAVGLLRFQELRSEAINAVTERFYSSHGADYAAFGPRGREACHEDLGFHLDFLRPVLEFGLLQPMVDYLRWLASVLATRHVPVEHLPRSLDWLAEFFATHMEEPDAAIVVQALHDTRTLFFQPDDAAPAIYRMMPAAWPESAAFESALLAGNRRDAGALLDRCLEQGHGLVTAELHMIQPALYSIGRRWQNNELSVAQEHLATAIAQSVMSVGLSQAAIPISHGSRVLLACVEGNNHSVGLQMVSDAFLLAGWEVQCLGANVPTSALIRHLGEFKPNLVALSVSFAQQLRIVKDIMSRLTQSLGDARPPVIIGGLAINQFNPLACELGADAWSPDAYAAMASASKFVVQAERA